MRKSNEHSLKEAIEQLLDSYRLRDKLNEVAIAEIWEQVMGAAISKRTNGLNIKNACLHIHISSAPLKQELLYQREQIKDRMNKELGTNYLKEVIIV
jgi:predicted nucleic acid-binding Zn ribbon protein